MTTRLKESTLLSERTATLQRFLDEVRAELRDARVAAEAAASAVAVLEKQERHLAELCGTDADLAQEVSGARLVPAPVSEKPSDPGPTSFSARVRAVAREAIAEAGRPLNRMEILEAVRLAGIPLPSVEPARKISKVLARDPGLRNVRGEGYQPVETDGE